jgi:hypothetical protein
MELTAENRDAISGAASAPQNSSILRQQRVGGQSDPDLPPYAVTNVATVMSDAQLALQRGCLKVCNSAALTSETAH